MSRPQRYAISSLSVLSHGALSNSSSSSSSSSSSGSGTLPDVRDLSGPESDSGDTLFSTSPSSPSPPTSVSTGRGRGTGTYGQRVDGAKISRPTAAATVSPSQGRLSRAAFNLPSTSSVREDPEEEEDEDPAHTSTYIHHRRFISSPERSRGLNKPVVDLTPRSRKAATALDRQSFLNDRPARYSLPSDDAAMTRAALSPSSPQSGSNHARVNHHHHPHRNSYGSPSSRGYDYGGALMSATPPAGASVSRWTRTSSGRSDRMSSMLFDGSPSADPDSSQQQQEQEQRRPFRRSSLASSSLSSHYSRTTTPSSLRRPLTRISTSSEALPRRHLTRWMSADLTFSPRDGYDPPPLSSSTTRERSMRQLDSPSTILRRVREDGAHDDYSSLRERDVRPRAATSIGNFEPSPSASSSGPTRLLRSVKSTHFDRNRTKSGPGPRATSPTPTPLFSPSTPTPTSAYASHPPKQRTYGSPPSRTRSGSVAARREPDRDDQRTRPRDEQTQTTEHVRLMSEALTVFETQLSRLPIMGTTTTTTVPDVFQDARASVRLAEQVNEMLRLGGGRALERQVDAEVEDLRGGGGGEDRDVDMVELWRDVGDDYRDCLRASNDLVRTFTRFLVGTGRVLREVSALHAGDRESSSGGGDGDNRARLLSSSVGLGAAPSVRSPSRSMTSQKSYESLRGFRSASRGLRSRASELQLRTLRFEEDVPPLPPLPRSQTPHDHDRSRAPMSPQKTESPPPPLFASVRSRRDDPLSVEDLTYPDPEPSSLSSSLATERPHRWRLTAPAHTPLRRDRAGLESPIGALPPSPPATASPKTTPPRMRVDSISSLSRSTGSAPRSAGSGSLSKSTSSLSRSTTSLSRSVGFHTPTLRKLSPVVRDYARSGSSQQSDEDAFTSSLAGKGRAGYAAARAARASATSPRIFESAL